MLVEDLVLANRVCKVVSNVCEGARDESPDVLSSINVPHASDDA